MMIEIAVRSSFALSVNPSTADVGGMLELAPVMKTTASAAKPSFAHVAGYFPRVILVQAMTLVEITVRTKR